MTAKTAGRGWKHWRIGAVVVVLLGVAKKAVAVVLRKGTQSPAEIRSAEKLRKKEIRRELRGLTKSP